MIQSILLADRIISQEEFLQEVAWRIQYFQEMELPRQSPILVQASISPSTIYWAFACFFSARIFIPIPNDLTQAEMQSYRDAVNPSLEINEKTIFTKTQGGSPFSITLCKGNEIWAVIFSSGSSGTPKAVALTRNNFEASARGHAELNAESSENIWLCSIPLYHVGGLSIFTRAHFLSQSVAYTASLTSIEAESWLTSGKITGASFVPTMIQKIFSANKSFALHKNIKQILVGGAACSDNLMEQMKKNSWPYSLTYGLTESCSQAVTDNKFLPGLDLKLNHDGEILLRGPSISPGYFSADHTISSNCSSDEYFATGDLGEFKEGNLSIRGRKKDIIISGGENFFPTEIEAAIQSVSGVNECAVAGIPDDRWGEKIVAICTVNNAEVTGEKIRELLRMKIGAKKIPKQILIVAKIPRTRNLKLIRQKVADFFQ